MARIRSIHHQKIELLKNLHEHEIEEQEMLLDLLDSQIEQVTEKARIIKKGLYCLLAAIAAFLFCSVFAGAAELNDWLGTAALGMGIIGIGLFLGGLIWAMRELSLSLSPLEQENAHLNVVTAHYLAKSRSRTITKFSKSA